MKYLFLRLLPKNILSRVVGYLTEIKVPSPLLVALLKVYCHFYKVRLHEAIKPLNQFNCFNDFFTRQLKPGIRPVDSDPTSVVSPVDGTVAEFGAIKNNLLIQTKGILYSVNDLVGKELGASFEDGYFLTIYLSPSDYHRIHSPVNGQVGSFSYFSGNLWPVNSLGIENVGGLFAINERIVSPIDTQNGKVALIKVGATCVGKIAVEYNSLKSNTCHKAVLDLPVNPPRSFQKGDEIGRFNLGSTVILLFEKNRFRPQALQHGKKLQYGQVIGYVE